MPPGGVRPRDGGPDRQKDVGLPVDVLVDTVARMQQDLANLRAENRLLRTRGFLRSCVPLDRRRSQRQKCHGLAERLVGNNTDRFSMLLCVRMAGTMIQRRCNCSHIWKGTH